MIVDCARGRDFWGAIIIKVNICSSKKDVNNFLHEMKTILLDKNFDINRNFLIIKREKNVREFSTPYLLKCKGYDVNDIIKKLTELTIYDYSETLIDNMYEDTSLLFVFGKDIDGRLVYIKLKIKGAVNRKVLCLSFHYAEREMQFPYRL